MTLTLNEEAELTALYAKYAPRIKTYTPVDPHPKQQLFLELDEVKEALFGGATGGGKTIALLMDALKYVHIPNYSALLLRRNFPDLKQEGGLIAVAHEWLQQSDAKWNEQDKQWTFPSGATLRFGYMDTDVDKYRYQGGEYQYIGFDELTQFTESMYRYLFSRLRKRGDIDVPLRIRGATNPGGIGGKWVYERFIPEEFSPTEAGKLKVWFKDQENGAVTAFVPSLLDDNPSLDQQSYLESLAELDEITREQYLKGDWLIQERGDILYTYSEAHSVISWSQFESVFGQRSIPSHWLLGVFQDWGTSPEHPCVTTWFATAAQNGPQAGKVFAYRNMVLEQCTAAEVGHLIKAHMEGERSRCRYWEMSHEAASERLEYNKQGLPFQNWKTGRNLGVEQLKNAFAVKGDDPHPFKPSLIGSPDLFLVVDDEEITNPKTDAGFVRHRAEIPAYSWAKLKSGEPMTKLLPHALFNDAVDTLRAAAFKYFPDIKPLTKEEKIEEQLTDIGLGAEQVQDNPGLIQRRMDIAEKMKAKKPQYRRVGVPRRR